MGKETNKGTEAWHNLGAIEALKEKGRHVLKVEEKQIAIFETKGGLFAINNRCPHEGYPLVEGTLNDDCTLACNWHGWAFDLQSGEALQGRDPVRTYPVERRGQDIWIDLSSLDSTTLASRAYAEFDEAVEEHDYARIARSLCRLEKAGITFEEVAKRVIDWSVGKFERGFGHAHAGLADWIELAGADGDLRLVAYLEAFGHFSWDGVFSPAPSLSQDILPWDKDALQDDLQAMKGANVQARIRGAFAEGLGFADIKSTMLDFVFSHYMGFGHSAIYVSKLETLVRLLGTEMEQSLALLLGRHLCLASREDQIPEFRSFGDYLNVEEGLVEVPSPLAFSGQSVRQSMALVAGSMAHKERLFDSLLAASALNMLVFDDGRQHRVEQPIAQNVGWLDFTHALTFAEAFYGHAQVNPEYWKSGLLQMACFVGRNARYLADQDWSGWRIDDRERFMAEQKAMLFNMDVGEYIYSVHRLKILVALEKLERIASPETTEMLYAAVNRYLHSHLRQRHPARVAFQARESVAHEG
ncbi:MAG: Rieske 2Fe-2S domain-containing protein [Alphaproteobacteria bacterium]|nr:Rieske 2Fe-2S domain-containing protein [Alphaproteobacteria bacterium]